MNIDSVVGRLARVFSGRLFDVDGSFHPVALPPPDRGRTYLLYLHVPFCRSLCPFCSFHRVPFKTHAAQRYFDALDHEISLVIDRGYRFDEVYFGGGTPTVMPARLLESLSALRERQPLRAVSVETNPSELDGPTLEALAVAGVTRLSVGVQTFDDGLLRSMQRYEPYGSSAAIRQNLARFAGVFGTVNVDMIFNLPGQTEASLRHDLEVLVDELGVDQVSFYPLMSTADTREVLLQAMGPAGPDNERRYYEILSTYLLDAGYTRNSSWCFSRSPGMFSEYVVDREEYVGLGSGSFSYLGGALYASTFSNTAYAESVAAGRTGTVFRRQLNGTEQMRYYLLMTLFGGALDLSAAESRFGGRFRRSLRGELAGLRLVGAVHDDDSELRLSERGQYLWVVLMREFFSGINRLRNTMRHPRAPEPRAA